MIYKIDAKSLILRGNLRFPDAQSASVDYDEINAAVRVADGRAQMCPAQEQFALVHLRLLYHIRAQLSRKITKIRSEKENRLAKSPQIVYNRRNSNTADMP